jgi:hypothetical protein
MTSRTHRLLGTLAASLALVVPALVVGGGGQPALAGTTTSDDAAALAAQRDGSSSDTAVASCWEARSAGGRTSGLYWLQTPRMVAPQQFYCDQTTDGGGWVLVGRGREGWGWSQNGQGTPEELRETVTGRDAFTPDTLSGATVDALLNGASPVRLKEGIRLRRARNNSGTRFQEVRLRLARTTGKRQPAAPWSWAMPSRQPLKGWRLDRANPRGTKTFKGKGGTTRDAGRGDAWALVSTRPLPDEQYTQGFGYGPRAVKGRSDGYLYRTGQGRTFPFTQVFLRPRLLSKNLSYSRIPDSGTPRSTVGARPENLGLDQQWGVAGSGDGQTTLYNDEVLAFAQAGDRMLVGGNFRYAQRGENGADRVQQPFLAAFDVDTAAFIPGFTPTFDGQVKALVTLPSGRVVVGGEFTKVNGVASPGLVAIDPRTGAVDRSWGVQLEERTSARLFVRALELRGNQLYVGGSFTHLTRGGTTTYARNAARLDVSTGAPDTRWRPELNGSVNAISVAPDGGRVYLAGFFTSVKDAAGRGRATAAEKVAVLRSTKAVAVRGLAEPTFSRPRSNYQQGIAAVGDRVFYGGAEHMLFGVDADTFKRTSSTVTRKGGDFQAVTAHGGLVLAGCHCNQYSYEGATTWPRLKTWTEVQMIRYVGAWDARTGQHVTDFYPDGVTSRAGHGAWAIEVDSNGTTWVGGDFTGIRSRAGTSQWTGGFFRLAPRDTTAPTAPADLVLKQNAQDPRLLNVNTTQSTDSSGRPVAYEILVGDRVVLTRNAVSGTIPMPPTGSRVFVRAVDREGNRSASTPVALSPAPA